MKRSIGRLVGPVREKMGLTPRRACGSCARRHLLGYPSAFTIYDQADAVRPHRLRAARPQHRPQAVPARSVHATISAAERRPVRRGLPGRASVIHERRIGEGVRGYQARKAGAHGLRRPPRRRGRTAAHRPQVLDHYRVPATCSPTSTRTPTRCERGHAARRRAPQLMCVVGDLDRCLVRGPWCARPTASARIECTSRVGDRVLGTIGHRSLVPAT